MTLVDLLKSLETETNQTLGLLEDIVVEKDSRIIETISNLIENPNDIEDANRFASLLEFFANDAFIPKLIGCISTAKPGETRWLADYIYALAALFEERDDYWVAEDELVNLLGDWLLSTGGGEISWKSGLILAEISNPLTFDYLLRGANDQGLFHQTRIACVRGIVNHYPDKAENILQNLLDDQNEPVRAAVEDAYRWIKDKSK